MKDNKKRRTCAGVEPLLQDYLDGAVQGSNLEQVELHLRTCRACAHAVAVARHGSALLSLANVPVDDPGPFFTHRVMAAVRSIGSAESEVSFWRPLGFLAMRTAWTASIALAGVLVYGAAVRHYGTGGSENAVQSASTRAIAARDPFYDAGAQVNRRDDFDLASDVSER